jgi:hypothetical protein
MKIKNIFISGISIENCKEKSIEQGVDTHDVHMIGKKGKV